MRGPLLLFFALASCETTPTKRAPVVVVEAAASASAAAKVVARDPPVVRPGQRVTLSGSDRAARETYSAAIARGRKATVAKSYAEAIAAFGDALEKRPLDARALAERGYAERDRRRLRSRGKRRRDDREPGRVSERHVRRQDRGRLGRGLLGAHRPDQALRARVTSCYARLTPAAVVRIVPSMKRLLVLAPLLLAACSLESNARSEFARQNSCPEDRVTVAHAPPRTAPPDVAADPGRLAIWNQNEAKRASHYYVASGCGRESLYLCEHRPSPEEAGLPDCLLQQSEARARAATP